MAIMLVLLKRLPPDEKGAAPGDAPMPEDARR
jgi:hypothetical protein